MTLVGVFMFNSCLFQEHIEHVTRRAKRLCGWILRSFRTREGELMLTLFRAMVLPMVEYCCQLWSPVNRGLIQKVESVQRGFTYKIHGASHNYWERLQYFDLYSLERRRERYHCIYVWKIINGHVPNFTSPLEISTYVHIRLGLLCKIPPLKNKADTRVKSIKENSFSVKGPRLFNSMPASLRSFDGSLETFKTKLDTWLRVIPDRPALPHYHQQATGNSILDQLAVLRAERS